MVERRGPVHVRATLVLRNPQALLDLPPSIAFPCRARARRQPDGTWHAKVIAAPEDLDELRHPDLVEVRRAAHVPGPNPASDYLTVDGVEAALADLAGQYPALTTLITLPNTTSQGSTSHALRIGAHAGADHAVLFTACFHASEWGGAEIALGFARTLLQAHQAGTALKYGNWALPGVVVQRIVAELDVVVFPCVNPDGRRFSQQLAQSGSGRWTRKNRNQAATPAVSDGKETNADEIGVDVDRNFDWLWDFRRQFSSQAVSPASDVPREPTFHGPARTSEAETRNVVWLFDQFPNLDRYLDIHSADGDVLYSWSDDTDQSTDPDQRFDNPAYSGRRGVAGGYGEYVTADDRAILQGSAEQVVAAVNAVGLNPPGHEYTAIQSCTLWGDGDPDVVTYPTSGTVDDWAFARSTNNPGTRTVYPLVVEFNFDAVPHHAQNSDFHPPWPVMQNIVTQVDAGLAQLCALALPVEGDPGGGGHQQTPLNEACYRLSVEIGQIEAKIAQLNQNSPGPGGDPALEKELAALQAKYAAQCLGHGAPVLPGQHPVREH